MPDIQFAAAMDGGESIEREYQKMIRVNAKLREELTQLATMSRKNHETDKEHKRLQLESLKKLETAERQHGHAVQQTIDRNKTAFEKYKDGAKAARELGLSQEQLTRELSRLAKEYKEAERNSDAARKAQAKENEELREAAQVIERTRTRQERYSASLERLNRLRSSGKLTAEQHARATKAEADAFAKSEPPVNRFAQALAQASVDTLQLNLSMSAGMKVIALLKSEYDALIARQDKAASAQITLAGAQENALGNLDQSLTPEAFLARMRAESGKLGIDEAKLTTAAASALSAKGDKSATAAVDAVVAASQFKRFGSADETAGLAGTALDFGKALKLSPEESLGFLAQTQRSSRVVTPAGMSENIAPAIVAGAGFGLPKELAGAVAASLSGTASDRTGAQTGTAMSSLFAQLRDFNPQQTVMQTLTAIQGDAQLRSHFLGKASFERTMQIPVEQLLTPGSPGSDDFLNALQGYAQQSPQQAYDQELAKKQASPAMNIATLQQRGTNIANQIRLDDIAGATSGVIRQTLEDVGEAKGGSAVGRRLARVFDDLRTGGTQTIDSAIASVEREKATLRGDFATDEVGVGMSPDPGPPPLRKAGLSPEETLLMSRLDSLITILTEQAAVERDRLAVGVVQGRRNNQGEAGP